ncbi:DUF7168 domain-containing protein [Azotobacter vinelandii]|uniref:DUF7168 domain-containing protein n=1 Tax=Azotobacter vinelandii TaxID=354 RepID=UPI000774B63E|nr:DUF2786 domain-containing protein [Azotobacter vinelandii]
MIPDRILRKIEACLALAGSDNPNEAATALRQAQKMMAEYGLTQLDLAAARIGEHSARARSGKRPPNYLGALAAIVARAFGTHPIYRAGWRGAAPSSELIFVGPDSHARISAYAFEVLQRQLLRDRSRYLAELPRRLKRSTKTRRADAFAEAWVLAVSRQIAPQAVDAATREAIEHYMGRTHGPLRSLTPRQNDKLNAYDRTAYSAGYRAGEAVQLHAGVESTRREALAHD